VTELLFRCTPFIAGKKTVLKPWLFLLDLRCVRFGPYFDEDAVLMSHKSSINRYISPERDVL
jgi:hypothetical protein